MCVCPGSSLSVPPVSDFVRQFDAALPTILINGEAPRARHEFDVNLLGNCDTM